MVRVVTLYVCFPSFCAPLLVEGQNFDTAAKTIPFVSFTAASAINILASQRMSIVILPRSLFVLGL